MTTAEGLLVAVRAVHFTATLALFGEIVFARLVENDASSVDVMQRFAKSKVATQRWLCRTTIVLLLVGVISGVCWLLLQATIMSGRPLESGWDRAILVTVLKDTLFGRVWMVRALFALALASVWLVAGTDRVSHLRVAGTLAVLLAAALVVSLAWVGHANRERGTDGAIHHLSDALHLLAAGAWLGGLTPFIDRLSRLGHSPGTADLQSGARVVTRFGALAAACVGLLLVTGVINARYMLHSPGALVDSPYGNLLFAKLILFLSMLAIASVNRFRLTPALIESDLDAARRSVAARRLRRNAGVEQVMGLGILLIVAVLGISSPPTGN